MALTPQNNDAFFREVDENLRQDQMVTAARRWGPVAIGVVVLLLAVLAGFLFWRNHRANQLAAASQVLNPALASLERGGPLPDQAAMQTLANGSEKGYAVMARFALADAALAKGDAIAAATTFNAIAADANVPQPQRDLALIRAVSLQFDTLKPDAVIDRLKGVAVPGNAFFPSAGELTALAWMKLGRNDKAGPLLAAIAREPTLPSSMRGRIEGLATTLGQTVAPATPAS